MKRRLLVVIMAIAVGAELLAVAKDGNNQKKSETINSSIDTAIVDASTSILKFSSLGGDSAKVTGYKSGQSPTAIDIPSRVKIDGKVYNVTSIGWWAFKNCSSLKSIKIPESMTSIGEWAFSKCYSLKSITIPEGVTSIGGGAFSGCDGVPPHLLVYDKGTKCYGWVGDESKCKEVVIPEGVTSIGDEAFFGCSSLTDIKIPKGVTSIGDEAFYGCKKLDVVIDNKEEYIWVGKSAFDGCKSVKYLK